MNILICTIGNRDINWRDLHLDKQYQTEREQAEHVLANYRTYRTQIRLPIIAKALRHVQQQSGDLAKIILIASSQYDQPPPQDSQAYHDWQSDTCLTAQIIQQCLADGATDATDDGWQAVPPERVDIWRIGEHGGNRDPSDYDGVRRFLEQQLPALHAAHPGCTAHLEVTGGTPAMTSGLLVAGTEVFGARAEVLYIHPRHVMPRTLNTGKRLQSGPLRSALRSNVQSYTYDVALRTLHEHESAIGDRLAQGAVNVLKALLQYAHCRYNFDFPGAQRALAGGIDRAGDGQWSEQIMQLSNAVYLPAALSSSEKYQTLLKEMYHGAAARYTVSAYTDFLTQVVRFQENTLRLLCLQRGAIFLTRQTRQQSDDGSLLQYEWANAQGYQGRNQRPGEPIPTGRKCLEHLLRFLAQQRGENMAPLLDTICADRMERLAWLRNEITHSLNGIQKHDLARSFGGAQAAETAADDILPYLADIYTRIARQPPGDSPFATINRLIDELLQEQR